MFPMSHRHHRYSGHQIAMHRDKIRQRWKVLIMLAVGLGVIVFFVSLSLRY